MQLRQRIAAIGVALLLGAAPGAAVTIDEVNPLYFPSGGANTGFAEADVVASGEPIVWEATDASTFVCAGGGPFQAEGACANLTSYQLTVVEKALETPVDQNPQGRGDQPTEADPLIATSAWTVANTSGMSFDGPLVLLFTNVDLTSEALGGSYPDIQIGLDANLFGILRYTVGGSEFFYGGVTLGSLAPGEEVVVPVRYVVAEELPLGPDLVPPEGPDVILPEIAVLGFVVPEPATAALLAAGLTALAAARRFRPCA